MCVRTLNYIIYYVISLDEVLVLDDLYKYEIHFYQYKTTIFILFNTIHN